MGWKIVEVETDEYLRLYFNNLLITREHEKILINLSDIDILIIQNDRAQLSTKLLNALTNKNICVILMNAEHLPQTYILPLEGHHMSLKIFEKQCQWTNQYKGGTWQSIVKNKLFNQLQILEKFHLEYPKTDFQDWIANVKPFDVTNREGHGAKVYWHTLFGKDFIRDKKATTAPVINSMLNYGYAIIRSTMIRSIVKKGLDTRIGLFHRSFGNFFALASDLMEPFRPIIDEIVYDNREAKIFNYEIRDRLVGVLDKKLAVDDKRFYLAKAMDLLVDHLIMGKGHQWIESWD